jgi:hypothetical protein
MKNLLLLTFLLFFINGLYSQTTAFSETFESGNSLTLVNGSQTNKWFRGNANNCDNVWSLYISNNNSAYQYTVTSAASTVHAYFDVVIPSGATNIVLNFRRKVAGEISSGTLYDYLRISHTINSFTPAAGTLVTNDGTNRVILGNIQGQTSCATTTYTLPNTIAGTTRRIIFTWRNDNSAGLQPPALIDNILVTYTPSAPPSCAASPTPVNGATNTPLTQQLSWPAVSGATGYDVYFGTTNPANTLVSSNQAGTTYNPGTLNPNTTYYWRIVPRNSNGSATGCSTWSFTTGLAGCLTATYGQWPTSTFTPQCNGTSETILIDAYASEYSLVNVVNGTQYTFSSSTTTDFITIGNSTGTIILASGNTPLTWTSTVTGTIRLYRHTNSSCGASTAFRIISTQCGSADPGPCFGITPYIGSNLPTQSNPTVQSNCINMDPPFGQFTDEYTEWTNGIAGTVYTVSSSVPTDWITITASTPNGPVVGFGSSPYSWSAPNNGSYYIHVSTTGFCGQDFNCRNITVERVSVLPVTLTSFTTECDNGIPLLKWITASEQNSDYFQIERSRDGIDWFEVSKVQAMGNSNTTKNYQFYDMSSGGNFEGYYRLKQVDFDGNFEYFGPKYIKCFLFLDNFKVEVFPNPTTSEIFIGIPSIMNEEIKLHLIDQYGRILLEKNILEKNEYILETMDLKNYSSGIYTLILFVKNEKITHRIIKK